MGLSVPWIISGVVLALMLVGLYHEVIYKMAVQWYDDPNNSHGFLVPLISLYLLYEKRDELRGVEIIPSNLGLPILLFGILMLIIGNVAAELFTMRFSLIVVMAGLIIFVAGFSLFRTVALPLGYLALMIPIPYILYNAIAFPLKLLAARSAVATLRIIEIPVYREGNIINLAQTTLEVADACSGIRSLMSLIALGVALSYFTQKGWTRRILLVFFAVPVAIFVNVLRVIVTGILAHYFGEKAATGFFHEFSGFVMFAVAMAILVSIGLLLMKFWKGPNSPSKTAGQV
jgi:exosortase